MGAIGFFVLLLLFGCTDAQLPIQNTAAFYYNEPDGLNTLDPARMSYRAAIWVGTQLYNGLVELDTNGRIIPVLARSWAVDSTGTVWTFSLRTDVWFHPDSCFGEKQTRRVTAHDVKFSFERICNAQTASTGVWVFRDKILGAQEYFQKTQKGIVPTEGIKGITVLDDSTIQFTLVKPFAPFLVLLTMPYCFVVPKEAIEYYGEQFFRHPVGTGPFRFHRWREDVELVLYRNPLYFEFDSQGERLPYLDSIVITFSKDTKSEFLQFSQGKYDFLSTVDPVFAEQIFTAKGELKQEYKQRWRLYKVPAYSIEYYGILLDTSYPVASIHPLATSVELRKALNYAIDRESIVQYVLRGRGIPAHFGILPPGFPGFDSSIVGYRFNPDSARQFLQRAGFPDGEGLPPLVLQLGKSERTVAVAEAVQEQWRKFGIQVELRQVDFPQHLEMVRTGKVLFWRTSWIADYPDPENFLALFYSANFSPYGPNTTHFSNPRFDSLYIRALSSQLPSEERYQLYNMMEKIVIEKAPWIFLYYNVIQRLVQRGIRGFTVDGNDRLILKFVRKELPS